MRHVLTLVIVAFLGSCDGHPDKVSVLRLVSYDVPVPNANKRQEQTWRRGMRQTEQYKPGGPGGITPYLDQPDDMPPWKEWGEQWDVEIIREWHDTRGTYDSRFVRMVKKERPTEPTFVLDDVAHYSFDELTAEGGVFSNELRTQFTCRNAIVCATLQKLSVDHELRATLQLKHPQKSGAPQVVTTAAISHRLGGENGREKLPPF